MEIRIKTSILVLLISILGCGGGQSVQQATSTNAADKTQQNPSQESKKTNDDDELLSLLEGNKTGQSTDTATTDLGASFEPIAPLAENESDSKPKSSEPVKKDTQKTETNNQAKQELNKLDQRVKNLKDNLTKKEEPVKKKAKKKTPVKKVQTGQAIKKNLGEPTSKSGNYSDVYTHAYNLFQQRQYDLAISFFEKLIDRNANHSLADNCQYWIGESHFAQKKYRQAILDFEKVLTFPKSNKNEDAQFKLAYCYVTIKDSENARIELQRFISKYPKNRNVKRARKMLDAL